MVISAIDALQELHHEHLVPQIPHQVTNNCNANNTLPLQPYLQMFRSRDNQTLTADDLCQLINSFQGLKFDPTDVEMVKHLKSKCGLIKPHEFLEYFITTLEEGSSDLHPNDLPGIKEFGTNYYFYRLEKSDTTKKKRKRTTYQWRQSGSISMICDGGCEIGKKSISTFYKDKENLKWIRHEFFLSSSKQTVGSFALWKIFRKTHDTLHPAQAMTNPATDLPSSPILDVDPWQSIFNDQSVVEKANPCNDQPINLDFLDDYSLDDLLGNISYGDITDMN